MNPSASSITRPLVLSRKNASAIGGEAIVRRLRGNAPAAAPLSRPRKGAAGDEKAPPRSLRKRAILVVALLLALGGAGRFGWHWWTHGRFEETTDNAFLQADKVVVAPKAGKRCRRAGGISSATPFRESYAGHLKKASGAEQECGDCKEGKMFCPHLRSFAPQNPARCH